MTQSQVLIVQHVPWEKPGRILDNLDDLNMSSTVVNIAKEKKPDLPDFAQVADVTFRREYFITVSEILFDGFDLSCTFDYY